MGKPPSEWQQTIWRAWRNEEDRRMEVRLFALVADDPADGAATAVMAGLGALYGACLGFLSALLWTAYDHLGESFTWQRALAALGAGALAGAVVALLVRAILGRRLTWRAWLARLAPHFLPPSAEQRRSRGQWPPWLLRRFSLAGPWRRHLLWAFVALCFGLFGIPALTLVLIGIYTVVALLAIALARRSLRGARRWPAVATAFAVGGIAAYQLCFFAGVARTGVAVGTLVGIGSAPVWGGAVGFLVQREWPGWRWAVATVLAVVGCGLVVTGGRSAQVDPLGVVLAVGAGASYAAYVAANKRLLELHPPEAVMAVVFCLGAVLLSPLLFVNDLGWLAEPRGLAVALHLGLVTVAVAYTLFARGLRTVAVATTVTLTLAEPLMAGILGVAVLGERLTVPAGVGIALLFGGLALLAVGTSQRLRPGRPEPLP